MMYMVIGLTALCAGILQGVTGFGAGIVMMMVLPVFSLEPGGRGILCHSDYPEFVHVFEI